jgi:MoxR-like ATPase
LVVFAKENIFFYGPPGTGKSLIDMVMQLAFAELTHFRFLMREGAKYEDLFGEEVTVDNNTTERAIEGKLPTAELAFLDETWKGDDAILNSLLTILNEKIFDDSYKTVEVPLYTAVGASNEFPRTKYLAAIFERFPIRIEVPNVILRESFDALVDDSFTKIEKELIPSFSKKEIAYVVGEQKKITNSMAYKNLFWEVRTQLVGILNTSEDFDGTAYQISGRTISKFGNICRTSAILNKRKETDVSDLFIGKYVLWKNLKERKVVYSVLDKLVFGDMHNILEDVDILLEDSKIERNHYYDELSGRLEYRAEIQTEDEYTYFVAKVEKLLMEYKVVFNKLEEKIDFFHSSENTYREIENNIFLYAPNVVSWRAMEAEIIKREVGESLGVMIERSDGLYIDSLIHEHNEMKKMLERVSVFLDGNVDYFSYRHILSERR